MQWPLQDVGAVCAKGKSSAESGHVVKKKTCLGYIPYNPSELGVTGANRGENTVCPGDSGGRKKKGPL